MSAPELSAEEAAIVARFEAAPVLEEAWEAEVERVARAMWQADGRHPDDWGTSTLKTFVAEQDRMRRLARAALAARRPATEAEEAVERVRKLLAFYDRHEYASLNVDDLRRALDPS